MSQILSKQQIVRQSESAINQWGEQWKDHAKQHSKFKQKSLLDFRYYGLGKTIVLMANGASLENDLDKIVGKNVDTFVCDKTLGHAIKKGIKPTFCLLADANVNYEKYCEPYKDQLKDTILLANVCGNPKWTHNAEWKDIYFFINKDVLESEKIYQEISGCPNLVPAGSNVSNAMVVLMCQSSNEGSKNWFAYDKYLLTGFDYSWLSNKNYYAYDHDGGGKRWYMKHQHVLNNNSDFCFTSDNLLFSAKWLWGYVTTFKLPIVQCSEDTLLGLPVNGKLEDHIEYNFDANDSKEMYNSEIKRLYLLKELESIELYQKKTKDKHKNYMIRTI